MLVSTRDFDLEVFKLSISVIIIIIIISGQFYHPDILDFMCPKISK